jgi:hypothetical protein
MKPMIQSKLSLALTLGLTLVLSQSVFAFEDAPTIDSSVRARPSVTVISKKVALRKSPKAQASLLAVPLGQLSLNA